MISSNKTLILVGGTKIEIKCSFLKIYLTLFLIPSIDSSSDEESFSHKNYKPPLKKQKTQYYNNVDNTSSRNDVNYSELSERNTVIVSPSKSNSDGGYAFNAASSSQDSESSEDEPVMPSVHREFIKPKSTAAPVINQKATAMMVSLLIIIFLVAEDA